MTNPITNREGEMSFVMSIIISMVSGLLLRGAVDLMSPHSRGRQMAAFICLYVGVFAMIKLFA